MSIETDHSHIQALEQADIMNVLAGVFKYYCATTNISPQPQCDYLSQQAYSPGQNPSLTQYLSLLASTRPLALTLTLLAAEAQS